MEILHCYNPDKGGYGWYVVYDGIVIAGPFVSKYAASCEADEIRARVLL